LVPAIDAVLEDARGKVEELRGMGEEVRRVG
jgi:hypothetical protein